jgi:ubiquinone/menaquinone biosynthesis C-methylase UbiE
MKNKQKSVFLKSEGNAWYKRNRMARGENKSHRCLDEKIFAAIGKCFEASTRTPKKLLEIGCSDASQFRTLEKKFHLDCTGLEPSQEAVRAGKKNKAKVLRGTAEALPFRDKKFDIVVFGFCLYVCDREDLFQIAFETDRVLKSQGWIVILDFYSKFPRRRRYHHARGVFSYKCNPATMFEWNPNYTLYFHELASHSGRSAYADQAEDLVCISVLRKNNEFKNEK